MRNNCTSDTNTRNAPRQLIRLLRQRVQKRLHIDRLSRPGCNGHDSLTYIARLCTWMQVQISHGYGSALKSFFAPCLRTVRGFAESNIGVLREKASTNRREEDKAMLPVLEFLLWLSIRTGGGRMACAAHAGHHVRTQNRVTEHIDEPPCQRPVCNFPHRLPVGGVPSSTAGITYRLF